MKFKIEFPNGKSETVEQADCSTVEQYINTRFGRGAKPAAKVTLVTGKAAPVEAAPVVEEAKPAKAAKAKK